MKPSYPIIRKNKLRAGIVMASAMAGAFGLGYTNSVVAQEGQEGESLEEVVVTGSRIIRRDFQSNSPIITVDSDDFETQTGLNIESYLNQLPTYNPATTPVTEQGDVQITPVNSVGIASISLRGFGPNRSLVLVNGKRPTPINALMVTDINGVPSALVERVETISGGASAVYGADAVSGVTNFILRDNFEGFEVDLQHGIHEAGDGDETRVAAVLGGNFGDGRGNVTLGIEYYNREEALQKERDIYVDNWRDPYSGGSFFFLQGVNAYTCAPNVHGCPAAETVNAMFADRPEGTSAISPFYGFGGGTFNFNSDSSIFLQSSGGLYRYNGPRDNLEFQTQRTLDGNVADINNRPEFDNIKWNNIQAFASAPQERYSFFSSGNFDITDSIEAFGRVTFAESKTETLLFGTNAIGGWETVIPYDQTVDSPVDPSLDYTSAAVVRDVLANPGAYANPNFIPTGTAGAHYPVPLDLAILLNARPNPDAVWQPNWNPLRSLPPRSTFNTNTVWQVETGINFELPINNWTGEAYFSHGQSATYNNAAGNLSLTRYRKLLEEPDYARGAVVSGNTGPNVVRPEFGAAEVTCTSGFYDTFFKGDMPLSEDCFYAINADLQTRTANEQNIFELNLQGPLGALPAGEVRGALGYQYRDNSAKFTPDILQSTASFTDQVVGVYPTGYMDASADVNDYYAELLVPVLSDLPGVDILEFELGARYSDYEHTDEETTWKAMANWQVNDKLRFRGGVNRATRAPNLGELFLNPQEVFTGGGNFGDACGIRSNAPFGMGGILPDPQLDAGEVDPRDIGLAPGQTMEGAQSVYLICQELMGGQGSPGATEFYTASNATGTGGGGFAWVYQEGNEELESEIADTATLGFVAQSPWENDWLNGLNLSFDWYRIEIEDAIMLYSLDHAAFRCYGAEIVSTQAEAAARAASPDCALISRDQVSGGALNTSISYDNQATIKTSGFDIGLNWFGSLDALVGVPGNLSLNLQATVLDYYKTKQSPANYDVETDWAGSLGPDLSGTNGGAYDYRLFGGLTYMKDAWSVTLRWRHLPGVYTAGYASQQAIIANNASVVAGGAGVILGYTPTTEIETSSYNIFDMSFNWSINETLTLRGGITNLFDEEPSRTGRTAGRPVGGDWMNGVCNGAPGCLEPTAPSLHGVGGFDGGYYDTLGRRMFLGMKASF